MSEMMVRFKGGAAWLSCNVRWKQTQVVIQSNFLFMHLLRKEIFFGVKILEVIFFCLNVVRTSHLGSMRLVLSLFQTVLMRLRFLGLDIIIVFLIFWG